MGDRWRRVTRLNARKTGLLLAMLLASAALAMPAQADPPHDVSVDVDDTGFNPSVVMIPVGGSVTWIERGLDVHTATSLGTAPQAFSTGGIGPFESRSLVFFTAGIYPYTSATDCQYGNHMPRFVCGPYYVVVVAPGAAAPALPVGAPTWTPVPPPTPGPTVGAPVPVSITDSAVSPPAVTIPTGGTVLWTNLGGQLHTATSTSSAPAAFATGGLAPGQSAQVTFGLPGTYQYVSDPDCSLNHAATGFNCGPYTVVVTGP